MVPAPTRATDAIEMSDTAPRKKPTVAMSSPADTQSMSRGWGSTALGRVRQPATRATTQIGTMTRKIQRHDPNSSIAAAIAGEANPSTPHTLELAASARPVRWWGQTRATAAVRPERLAPPPAPGPGGAPSKTAMDGARAARSDEAAKKIVAHRNTADVPRESISVPVMAVATA